MFDIATIGSATRDAFFVGDFPLIPWPKSESGKAYLLPFGEKLDVKQVFFTIGGNAANASVTFARQGFKTACVAKVGSDVSGEEITRRLDKERVRTGFLRHHLSLPTSYSVLLLQEGERTILNYRGVADSFSLKDVDLEKLRAKWWYVSLAGESDRMFKELLKFAREKNIAVAFNPSGHHIRHKRQEIFSSLRDISFLVLNEEEAALLTGVSFKNEKAVFKKLDKLMLGILAVTDGRNGATVSDGKYVYKAGVFKEKKLVDRTGAGDAFGSGFVAGLMRRNISRKNISSATPEDIKYAIRLATANATSVVEKIGATEGTLTKKSFTDPRWSRLNLSVQNL